MTIETSKIPTAMSGSKLKVLCAVAEDSQTMTMTDLAKMAGISTAGITGAVDSLAKDGLVERAPVEGDRRMHRVLLTSEGLELVNSMRAEACGREGE